MLFSSWGFALLIAVLLPVYYLVPKKLQQGVLLLANLVFYAFAGWFALLLLVLTALSAYAFARGIGRVWDRQKETLALHRDDWEKAQKKAWREQMEKRRRVLLVLCLVLHFGILFGMKYGAGAVGLVNSVFGTAWDGTRILLTMGASFYTFSTMGYVIDVHRGKYPAEKNPLRVLLFTSFFPILVQGPISRFDTLGETLFLPHAFERENLEAGLVRVLWGYAKKLLVADRLLVAVKQLLKFPDTYNGAFAFLGMLLYAATLYADFTGGIDITIGIAQVLGVKVQENFIRPYFSRNIAEYWRRWHISMGTWFKDYIFFPMSDAPRLMKLSKKIRSRWDGFGRKMPVYLSTLVTWFLTGLWHGAAWNFVVWGLLNAVIILIAEEFKPLSTRFRQRFPRLTGSFGYRVFEILRTFLIMCSLRMLDCYRNVPVSFRAFGSVFTAGKWREAFSGPLLELGLSAWDYRIAGLGVLLMFLVSVLQEKHGSVRELLWKKPALPYVVFPVLALIVLCFGAYGVGYDASQFIYNQF